MFNQHNPHIVRQESRSVSTPDGMTHVVAMGSQWWECLEWMLNYKEESLGDIADFCMRFRMQYPEDDFTTALQLYIEMFMRDHRQACFGLANDDLMADEREQFTR